MAIETLPRFFAMARGAHFHSLTGWYVCDSMDADNHNVAKPIHQDPITEETARALAKEKNEAFSQT